MVIGATGLNTKEIYNSFWAKPGERIADKRRKACETLKQIFNNIILHYEMKDALKENMSKNKFNASDTLKKIKQEEREADTIIQLIKNEAESQEKKEVKQEQNREKKEEK